MRKWLSNEPASKSYSLHVGPIYQLLLISQFESLNFVCWIQSFCSIKEKSGIILRGVGEDKIKNVNKHESIPWLQGWEHEKQPGAACLCAASATWLSFNLILFLLLLYLFFLNVGWTFFCPWSSRCRKRYLTGLNPLPPPDEQRRWGRQSLWSISGSFTHMLSCWGYELRHSLITEIDVGCFSTLTLMSPWHRTSSDHTRMQVYLQPVSASAEHVAGLSACLASNYHIQIMTRQWAAF